MTVVVIDDHLLLRALIGDPPRQVRRRGTEVLTTGLWYHRLCRALSNDVVTGRLSGSLGATDAALGRAATAAVTSLPEHIGVVSLRELAWPMARLLERGARLSLLSLEALAVAEARGATLLLAAADENPPLLAAAAEFGVGARVISS